MLVGRQAVLPDRFTRAHTVGSTHITEETGAPFQIDFRTFGTHMRIFPPLRGLMRRRMMWERPLVSGQRVAFTPWNQLTERRPT